MDSDFYTKLIIPAQTKIIMLVLDGLGGLPHPQVGKTELEIAHTPNLDSLAGHSELGLTIPVGPGITPGSGPGHLALFGYDPSKYEIGRGAMEALGVDFELQSNDLAARGNFCTVDPTGLITDRRAGRIATEKSQELIKILSAIQIPGVQIFIEPVKEHRFALVVRGDGLRDGLTETDPQRNGVPPLPVLALEPGAETSAKVLNQFLEAACKSLDGYHPANMVLLRGFAKLPTLPDFHNRYGLNAAGIAVNGMYRGVARLVGMQVLDIGGDAMEDEFIALEEHWERYDFFYLHIKKTDTCGEMGDFDGKVRAIEEVDGYIPRLLSLDPDVLIVCSDHSSPAILKAHSWHPVPLIIHSPYVQMNDAAEFGESACRRGSLGLIPATQVMPIALAHALRLSKYGA
jgi:2,3-bisphosphoglycerate-independent phosphoglycerate mutase